MYRQQLVGNQKIKEHTKISLAFAKKKKEITYAQHLPVMGRTVMRIEHHRQSTHLFNDSLALELGIVDLIISEA